MDSSDYEYVEARGRWVSGPDRKLTFIPDDDDPTIPLYIRKPVHQHHYVATWVADVLGGKPVGLCDDHTPRHSACGMSTWHATATERMVCDCGDVQ